MRDRLLNRMLIEEVKKVSFCARNLPCIATKSQMCSTHKHAYLYTAKTDAKRTFKAKPLAKPFHKDQPYENEEWFQTVGIIVSRLNKI